MATGTRSFLRMLFGVGCLLGSIGFAHATPATDWLQAQSRPDGSYQSGAPLSTGLQATSETLLALEVRNLGDAPDAGLARDYLVSQSSTTTEELARRIRLERSLDNDVQPLIERIGDHQNRDGGFGDRPGYTSTVLDTAWALEVLAPSRSGYPDAVARAVGFLMDRQQPDGSWSVPGSASTLYTTALALRALARVRDAFDLEAVIVKARDFLLNARDSSGAIGVPHESAAALLAIAPIAASKTVYSDVVASLESRQSAEGSWNGSVFATALAVQALALAERPQPNPSLGSIRLRLVDGETGQALEGVTVTLSGADTATTSTDAAGEAVFTGLTAGTYTLAAEPAGYFPLSTSTDLVVGADKTLGVVRLLSQVDASTAALQGTLTDGTTGAPIPDATITLSGVAEAAANTDADGRFLLDRLTAGSVTVSLEADGYRTVRFPLTLQAGTTHLLSRSLQPAAGVTFNGTATARTDGTPIADATVAVTGASSADTVTAADGSYQLTGLSDGALTITISQTGFEPAAANVNARDGQVIGFSPALVAEGESDPSSDTGNIRGSVVDAATEAPISGATVELIIDGTTHTTTTDGAGDFRLADAKSGNAVLSLSAAGYRDRNLTIDAADGVTLDLGFLRLTPGDADAATATGVLVDSITNEPLAGRSVTVRFEGYEQEVVSAADGTFSFEGPAEIEGTLLTALQGYLPNELPLILQAGTNDLGQVRIRPEGTDDLLPDLTITGADTSGVRDDAGLLYDGDISVDVKNAGKSAASMSFEVSAFIDRDLDGVLANGDKLLGVVNSNAALDSGDSVQLSLPVKGTVPFRDAPISLFVDSRRDISESNESNNRVMSGALECRVVPPPIAEFNPALKWKWLPAADDVDPSSKKVDHGPIVVPWMDTNSDGVLTDADVPAVVFISYRKEIVRAIRGDTAEELWSRTEKDFPGIDRLRFDHKSFLAAADLDGDGFAEIVTGDGDGETVAVLEHTGDLKWHTEISGSIRTGSPAIADLDADGSIEIIAGNAVLDASDGSVLWTYPHGLTRAGRGSGPASLAADLDLDGRQEVIMSSAELPPDIGRNGLVVLDSAGSILWTNAEVQDGLAAVGNFDADEFGEIVIAARNTVSVVNHDGSIHWGPVDIPGSGRGGAPTVADVDGDGEPEIGVAAGTRFTVFETDGTVKWTVQANDRSSNVTGSTVFDFDDDGSAELVYGDQKRFRVFRGETGEELFNIENRSHTAQEMPVVADIDGDERAELLVVGNGGDTNGIRAFEASTGEWAPTRPVWNQHSYHITNINDDGSIPVQERPSWQVHNTYRLNRFVDRDASLEPDLTASLLEVVDHGPGTPLTLRVRVGNAGAASVSSGLNVRFFAGDPEAGGVELGSTTVPDLVPGEWTDVAVDGVNASELLGVDVFAVADAGNALDECDESNNVDRTPGTVASTAGEVAVKSDAPAYSPGSLVAVDGKGTNEGTFAGDFRLGLRVEDEAGAVVADLGETALGTLASGEAGNVSATWPTDGIVAGRYTIVATLYGSDGRVADEATTSVVVQPVTNDGPTATLDTAPGAAVYGPNGTVSIEHLVRNVSPNAVLFGAALTTVVIDPDGMERNRSTIGLGDLLAGAQRQRLVNHVLDTAPQGTWTVEGILRDKDGTLLARNQGHFDVEARPLAAVSGTVEALHPVRTAGEPQTCTDLVENAGDRAVQLEVRRLVLNRTTGSSVTLQSDTVSLAPGASDLMSRGVDTTGLSPGIYSCALQVRDAAEWRSLDTAEFEVEVPPIHLEGELAALDRGRLLVLLDPPNRNGDRCKGLSRVDVEARFERALDPDTRFEINVHDHRGRLVDSEWLNRVDPLPVNRSAGGGADLSLVSVDSGHARLRLTTTTPRALARHYRIGIRAWQDGRTVLFDREWVRTGCRDHENDSDEDDDRHDGDDRDDKRHDEADDDEGRWGRRGDEDHPRSGRQAERKTDTWFGWGGWHRNGFETRIVDTRPWPAEGPDRLSEREWLEQTLDREEWAYRIVTGADAFRTELRSGGYENYALLAGHIKLPVLVQRELHAAVARGAGLLAAGWHDARNRFLHDTLGIRLRGRLPGVESVRLDESPLHDGHGDTHPLKANDKPLRVCVAEGEVAARYTGGDRHWRWHEGERDDHDARAERHGANGELASALNQKHRQTGWRRDSCGGYFGRYHDGGHHRGRHRDTAVSYRELLDGRTVFAGFDLLAEARAQEDSDAFEALLLGALEWSHPPSLPNPADAVRGYQVTVDNLGVATPGRVVLTLPDAFGVVDAGEGTISADDEIEWTFDLNEGEAIDRRAWLRLPDTPGDFTLDVRIQSGTTGSYRDQAEAGLTVGVTARPTLDDARADACTAGWRYWSVCGLLKWADRKVEHGRYRHALIKLSIAEWKLRRYQQPPGPAIHAGVLHGIRRVERLWWLRAADGAAP